jgi:hypothetical protein
MKYLAIILLLLLFNKANSAIEIPIGSIQCNNKNAHQKVFIHPKKAIVIWYRNENGVIIKKAGIFENLYNGIVDFKQYFTRKHLQIPLDAIEGISMRKKGSLSFSGIALSSTSFLIGAIIKLLKRVDKTNNNSNNTPNDGNGLAGVVGIVTLIITLPFFVLSGYWFVNQISKKAMKVKNGWQFSAVTN